jgi:predicted Zn finger-like uncharacterized protein
LRCDLTRRDRPLPHAPSGPTLSSIYSPDAARKFRGLWSDCERANYFGTESRRSVFCDKPPDKVSKARMKRNVHFGFPGSDRVSQRRVEMLQCNEHTLHMSSPPASPMDCPHCGANYDVVRIDAGTSTEYDDVKCLNCGGALPAREGRFTMKYFLVPRRRQWERRARLRG